MICQVSSIHLQPFSLVTLNLCDRLSWHPSFQVSYHPFEGPSSPHDVIKHFSFTIIVVIIAIVVEVVIITVVAIIKEFVIIEVNWLVGLHFGPTHLTLSLNLHLMMLMV